MLPITVNYTKNSQIVHFAAPLFEKAFFVLNFCDLLSISDYRFQT